MNLRLLALSFLLSFSLTALSTDAGAADPCDIAFLDATVPVLTNKKLESKARKLCFSEFAVIHSGLLRTPLLSAEHLTKARVLEAKSSVRVDKFYAEPRLPADERSELADFRKSGMDRGHMLPFKDMATPEGQEQSFSLANIVPQDPDNNQKLFAGIEMAVRDFAIREGDLYVVTGALFEGASLKRLNGRVYVPTSLYKVIYAPRRKAAAAYLVANAPGPEYEIVSVRDIEARAGINLFPTLPDSVKTAKLDLPPPLKLGKPGSRQNQDSKPAGFAESVLKALTRHR